ncbi:hypothetical protein FO519_010220, partial [Halicephalobus sp. NKZ332]
LRIPRSAYKSVECKKNEVIIVCKECDVQCASLNKTCPDDCKATWSCGCDHGFARDPNSKKCIPTEQCPLSIQSRAVVTSNITCGKNEELYSCMTCDPTCSNPNSSANLDQGANAKKDLFVMMLPNASSCPNVQLFQRLHLVRKNTSVLKMRPGSPVEAVRELVMILI